MVDKRAPEIDGMGVVDLQQPGQVSGSNVGLTTQQALGPLGPRVAAVGSKHVGAVGERRAVDILNDTLASQSGMACKVVGLAHFH